MSGKRQCMAIKAGGERCSARAQQGHEWCWNHDPARAEERKANASRGGRARSRRPPDELERIKSQLGTINAAVLRGSIDRGRGAVLFQGYNTLLRCVEVQRKLDHQGHLEEQVAELAERLEVLKGRGHGAA